MASDSDTGGALIILPAELEKTLDKITLSGGVIKKIFLLFQEDAFISAVRLAMDYCLVG